MTRHLYLLRHAHAASWNPLGDRLRPLDEIGQRQAALVGEALAGAGIDHVLVSPSARTRQTVAGLGLGPEVTVEVVTALYGGGSGTLIEIVREIDEEVGSALVCGHNPDIASACYRLVDEERSDPEALELIATNFPTATCCHFEVEGEWDEVREDTLRLVATIRTRKPKG